MRLGRLRWWYVMVALSLTALAGGETTMPKLAYVNGGRVIENVKVVPVLWSPGVDPATQAGVGAFYRALVISSVFDFLNEYTTVRTNGTQQNIGVGTSVDPITLVLGNTSSRVSDAELQAELEAQIASGALPRPDANTVYMLHFPPGLTIAKPPGLISCIDYCAYHSSGLSGSDSYRYVVMPDNTVGGCTACNGGLSPFQGMTISASHELFEAITEPNFTSSHLTWIDRTPSDPASPHGEIGDICERDRDHPLNVDAASIPGPFTIQREWSNRYQACIVSKNDAFSVTLSPGALSVAPGGTATLTATLALPPTPTSEPVSIRVAGLPDGGTLLGEPLSALTGQSVPVSLQVAPTVPIGTYDLMALFAGAQATIYKSLSLSVSKDDLQVSLAATDLHVKDGASTQVMVVTTNSGNAKDVTFAIRGLPDGLTATFEPPMVRGGESSTLTLTASTSAKVGKALPFSVMASAGSFTPTVDATVTVDGAGCSSTSGAPALALVALVMRGRRRRPGSGPADPMGGWWRGQRQ